MLSIIALMSVVEKRPDPHQVELEDMETCKWDGKKSKIGF